MNAHHVHPLEVNRAIFAYQPQQDSCDDSAFYSSSEGMVKNYHKEMLFSMVDIARYARDNGHDYFSLVNDGPVIEGLKIYA